MSSMQTQIVVPDIIKDDAEKVIAFLEGAGIHQERWNIIGNIYGMWDGTWAGPDPTYGYTNSPFLNEEVRRLLPPRPRALINCYLWGQALRCGPQVYTDTPEERERTGSMDACHYMHWQASRYEIPSQWWLRD